MYSFSLVPFLMALPALAAPAVPKPPTSGGGSSFGAKTTGCSLANATVDLPSGSLLAAAASSVSFVAIGVGVQNYTCSSAGTYTSTGAVAQLYDTSCLVGTTLFSQVPDIAIAAWSKAPSSVTASTLITSVPEIKSCGILGQHYFVTNPVTGTGLSPKWDFTSSGTTKGNKNAFVVAAKSADIPSPQGATNVDWLSLSALAGEGELASQVYRTDTRLGQPPSNCTVGSKDISVKYVANYWLVGSTL